MKIGYPCINRSLQCQGDRTFRLRSFSPERFGETVENNLSCLLHILQFNKTHGILFFRITSELIPFASHPVCTIPWQDSYRERLKEIGAFIKAHHMRISMHPDQFTLLNSPDEKIFIRSVAELAYHCDVLDGMELAGDAKIQIHVGGLYGDRKASLKRFMERYGTLEDRIKKRLVIEHDDRSYPLSDCLELSGKAGVPVLFDSFHHRLLSGGEKVREALEACKETWKAPDGIPMADYSSQEPGKRRGTHATTLDPGDFRAFLKASKDCDFDLMLEIKDKEKSALKALEIMKESAHAL
ncbi:MAG: UV DNA damage repair endonuclease UvsE [Candidatus Eremiobacteraeota bacterium]|nr:UV DNA damage repair endonuclease UvsE [Candidatus Eremiobacteraeota bacterium]